MKTRNAEIELTTAPIGLQSKIQNQKSQISSWWFSYMRQIVDAAPTLSRAHASGMHSSIHQSIDPLPDRSAGFIPAASFECPKT